MSLEIFIESLTDRISSQLEIDKSLNLVKGDVDFMEISLLLIGLIIRDYLQTVLGRVEGESAQLYRFPDVPVGNDSEYRMKEGKLAGLIIALPPGDDFRSCALVASFRDELRQDGRKDIDKRIGEKQ